MDNINGLLGGFADVITPMNLLIALLGVLIGTAVVGATTTIVDDPAARIDELAAVAGPVRLQIGGPAMTVALLLPLTYGLPVEQSLILFAGIFYGGMYGGSTTSILLNTPGESASVVTALEGNKMAKSGRAAQALATAAGGSTFVDWQGACTGNMPARPTCGSSTWPSSARRPSSAPPGCAASQPCSSGSPSVSSAPTSSPASSG